MSEVEKPGIDTDQVLKVLGLLLPENDHRLLLNKISLSEELKALGVIKEGHEILKQRIATVQAQVNGTIGGINVRNSIDYQVSDADFRAYSREFLKHLMSFLETGPHSSQAIIQFLETPQTYAIAEKWLNAEPYTELEHIPTTMSRCVRLALDAYRAKYTLIEKWTVLRSKSEVAQQIKEREPAKKRELLRLLSSWLFSSARYRLNVYRKKY